MNLIKDELKVGIVADWFITYAGSEKVVSEFLKVFPNADLYSVVDFYRPITGGNLMIKNRNHLHTKIT